MKLKLALAIALLAVSTSAVQAADKGTPNILASVSTDSVQTLSKSDASNTRGEYRISYRGRFIGYYGFKNRVRCGGGLSCTYLGKLNYKGTKYYVSR
jgi:phosphate-selective porin